MADLISVKDCPCDGCKAKPCGHPARCVKFTLWLNKTVDAVPVVRCKDCKYYRHGTSCVCELHSEEPDQYGRGFEMQMLPNDFCPYGERRANETD